jgi:hypothetical protein
MSLQIATHTQSISPLFASVSNCLKPCFSCGTVYRK